MPPPPGMPAGMPGFPPAMPGMPMPGRLPGGMPMPIPGMPMPTLPGMPLPSQHTIPAHAYRERSPHRSRHSNEDDYTREMRQYSDTRSRIKRENNLPEFDTEMV